MAQCQPGPGVKRGKARHQVISDVTQRVKVSYDVDKVNGHLGLDVRKAEGVQANRGR